MKLGSVILGKLSGVYDIGVKVGRVRLGRVKELSCDRVYVFVDRDGVGMVEEGRMLLAAVVGWAVVGSGVVDSALGASAVVGAAEVGTVGSVTLAGAFASPGFQSGGGCAIA